MPDSMTMDNPGRILDLKVAGRLMTLDAGLYCIFHATGAEGPAGAAGEDLPGVRISRAPGPGGLGVGIATFDDEGWLGSARNAALVRVPAAAGQILITIYQDPARLAETPRLQVVRLADAPGPAAAAPPPPAPGAAPPFPAPPPPAGQKGEGAGDKGATGELTAHIQRRGDVATALADWMGTPGSRNWIEGFAIAPARLIAPDEIEYQAVLGRGWLSPWASGGQFCGSRGMALPILGLRVRLKPPAAGRYRCRVWASFTDGSRTGPVANGGVAEAESGAPLEAFRVEILPAAPSEHPDEGEQALLAGATAAKAGRRARKPAEPAPPAAEAPAKAPRSRRAKPAGPLPEPPAVAEPAKGADPAMAPPAARKRRTRTGEPVVKAPAAPVPAAPVPADATRPGRGRKAPGSRVGLLKARRQMAARGRSRQDP
ncbi:hypothetical protein [Gluconacetobacter takamatsuzukensis]|uniref:Hydrophobic W protein n=1 Tax=Gluconacetobacter takamatsuzukensis TaxID=1286190 RepID=A0A7W4KBL2_9PROT|nr:hypothetical protein [Gluconacetobacter takamatsuzukensis]MBB2203942.1 hypothetical protein [Gluconacetobacter takamatsuzukensis]